MSEIPPVVLTHTDLPEFNAPFIADCDLGVYFLKQDTGSDCYKCAAYCQPKLCSELPMCCGGHFVRIAKGKCDEKA